MDAKLGSILDGVCVALTMVIFGIELIMQEGRCSQLYEKYHIETQIGRGASGVCYSVQNIRTKEIMAMKKIHVTSMKRHSTREACSEVQILAKLNHPHIIRLHEFFSDEDHLYIIMQYASKGDLHQLLKRRKIRRDLYTEPEIWAMARQLLSALEYLHTRSVIHRDVKTLNIFVDAQSRLYLGDLGVSKILKTDCGLYSRVGTPLYLAPEIIRSQKYDYKADIWGLGCVCYQLASLEHPFEGKNIIHLGQNIVGAQPKPLENYSSSLNAFVLQMLEKNPHKRPTAADLLKKYFQDKSLIIPNLEEKDTSHINNMNFVRFEGVNKITGGRQLLEMRGSRMKRQAINNYLEEKLDLRPDVFKEDSLKDKRESEDLQQTIILGKKGEMHDDAKKYVEATRKTYLISRSENIQSLKSQEQERQYSKQLDDKDHNKNNILSFSSEKKFGPQIDLPSKSNKNSMLPSQTQYQHEPKKGSTTDVIFSEVSRLPSETSIVPTKARIRPKSSIMTKERHQSTMKNIRKNFKREIEDLDSYVETRFLKKPQVIML